MQPIHGRLWQRVVASSMVVAWLMIAAMTPVAQAGSGDPNPQVFPIDSTPYGLTYGEWSARWWQWTLAIPADVNPAFDPPDANCAVGQMGPVQTSPKFP